MSDHGYSLIEAMVVVGLIGVISAIAIPMTGNSLKNFRITGDARSLSNTITLAKMRAAATFNRTRVRIDLGGRSFRLETWQKSGTPGWVTEGGVIALSTGVSYGFGSLASPPPNTQATIAQAPSCLDGSGNAIGNTACVSFNSRGIPVDATGAPTGVDAAYVTDGMAVYGVTVSASGLIQVWQSPPVSVAWVKQ